MRLCRRFMRPPDVAAAVALVASEPGLRDRYGPLWEHLPAVWLKLLRHDSLNAVVIEDSDHPHAGMMGVAVTAFVTDEFVRLCKRAPMRWIGPQLLRLIYRGEEPVLTPAALRAANSDGGLNLLIWMAAIRGTSKPGASAFNGALVEAFFRGHAGFRLKEIISQPDNAARAQLLLKSGMCRWDGEAQQYAAAGAGDLTSITDGPIIVGVTRALASQNIWMNHQFDWVPPRIGFAQSEQRLLRAAALNGGTDEELSRELLVSVSTVKKTWRTIFQRVAQTAPDLLPKSADGLSSGRGKEKRGRLLAYVRQRPEELRPYKRSSLSTAIADNQ